MAPNEQARCNKADVRDALTVAEYATQLGIPLRRVGSSLRGPCPLCGGSRRATKFCITGDKWLCHACGEGGDVFTLAMRVERCDFASAVERLASLAGLSPMDPMDESSRERQRAARAAQERAQQAHDDQQRLEAEERAPAIWASLDMDSETGCGYLASRGIHGLAGEVRYGKRCVCLPLRQTDGRIINVIGRRFNGGMPKVRGLRHAGTLGMFGDARVLEHTTGPVMLVEGVFDWMSARVLWPDRLVLGAHGAKRLADIARRIAPALVERRRALFFVPHQDRTGRRETIRAMHAAMDAGTPADSLFVFDVGDCCNDLNDYLREIDERKRQARNRMGASSGT